MGAVAYLRVRDRDYFVPGHHQSAFSLRRISRSCPGLHHYEISSVEAAVRRYSALGTPYRAAPTGWGVMCLAPGRSHQMKPPASTMPIAINCVPDITPPKTVPRPGSSRMNSRKNLATP